MWKWAIEHHFSAWNLSHMPPGWSRCHKTLRNMCCTFVKVTKVKTQLFSALNWPKHRLTCSLTHADRWISLLSPPNAQDGWDVKKQHSHNIEIHVPHFRESHGSKNAAISAQIWSSSLYWFAVWHKLSAPNSSHVPLNAQPGRDIT